MSPIRVLIVDDDPQVRRRIRALLADEADVEVAGECADGPDAVRAIQAIGPDLVYLDVQLPTPSGFEVLEAIDHERRLAVVFMTGYHAYTLKGFEAHGVDYLLKPFDRVQFGQRLQKARGLLKRAGRPLATGLLGLLRDLAAYRTPVERLAVRSNGRVVFLPAVEIDWIDASGNYARLHVGGEVHRLRERLKHLEVRLDPAQFLRIHRSTIVNVDRVQELRRVAERRHVVILRDGTRLTTGRRYGDRVHELLGRSSSGTPDPGLVHPHGIVLAAARE